MAPGGPLPPPVEPRRPVGQSGGASHPKPRSSAAGPARELVGGRPGPLVLLRWALVLVFAGAGVAKLLGVSSTVTLFAMVALGQWFRYAVGIYELAGAALLAYSRTAGVGATALIALMVGAGATEILILERVPLSSGATLIALAVVVAGLRRERTHR
jgi:DoxX-like protein